MKRIFFFITIMALSMMVKAQGELLIPKGAKVGTVGTGGVVTISVTEFKALDGVTSNIQDQLNGTFKISDGVKTYRATQTDSIFATRPVTLLRDNTQHSLSNTNVATTVYTGTIPANTLASGGQLVFENLLSFTGSTNAKTIRIKINGTDVGYFSTSTAANVAAQNTYRLWLRSGNSQIGQSAASNSSNGFTVGTMALTTYSFNYTQDWTVTVAITMASSAETTSLESFNVVYFP